MSSGLSGLAKGIGDGLGSLASGIKGVWDGVIDVGNKVVALGTTIVNGIKDGLKALFIPSNDFISTNVDTFKKHFKFIDTFTDSASQVKGLVKNASAPAINIDLKDKGGVVKFIDFSFYAPYKAVGDVMVTAFVYVLFLWRVFKRLPEIIRGAGIVSEGVAKNDN